MTFGGWLWRQLSPIAHRRRDFRRSSATCVCLRRSTSLLTSVEATPSPSTSSTTSVDDVAASGISIPILPPTIVTTYVDHLRRLPPTTSGNRLSLLPSRITSRHDFRRPSWPPLATPRVCSALVGGNHSPTGRNESSSHVISTGTSPRSRLVIIVSTTSDW